MASSGRNGRPAADPDTPTGSTGRMHGYAQFAGPSSVLAHAEMMGLTGMGNNPMFGATVACAVAVENANK